jgi:hypothetical protein
MTIVVYPAVIAASHPTGLSARFVDFADVEVVAASPVELIQLARERLGAALQRIEDEGGAWPEPTPVGDLAVPTGGSVILVDVAVDDTPVRLTISIGERLLKRIDEDAASRSMTRSGYLAFGARQLLGEATSARESSTSEAGQKIHDELDAMSRRLNEALGPNSAFGRALTGLDALALEGLRRIGGEVRSAMRPRRRADGPDSRSAPPGDPPPASTTP